MMPDDAPAAKLAATRGYGAEIIQYDRYAGDREEIGERLVGERGALLVPPFDDPLVMAGAGTAAAELLEEVPDLDFLLVPVSGGGLIAGSATAAKHPRPETAVYGVEPETGNDVYLSMERGERVSVPPPPTVADGVRTTSPGELTFPILRENVDRIALVTDDEIKTAVRFLALRARIVVEPTGAVGAAAVLSGKIGLEPGAMVGVVLSGGNIDPELLVSLLHATAPPPDDDDEPPPPRPKK